MMSRRSQLQKKLGIPRLKCARERVGQGNRAEFRRGPSSCLCPGVFPVAMKKQEMVFMKSRSTLLVDTPMRTTDATESTLGKRKHSAPENLWHLRFSGRRSHNRRRLCKDGTVSLGGFDGDYSRQKAGIIYFFSFENMFYRVLISDRHVLTAIHCFYSYENDTTCRGIKFDTDSVRMLIHYGGVCIRNAEKDQCENQDTQTVQIKKVVLGKEFPETHCQSGNDVAIVELTEKIKLGGNAQAICLKNMSSDDMELPSYPTCGMNRTKLRHFTSMGWGRDDANYSPAGLRFVHALPRCLRGNSIISVGMSNNRGSSSETRRGICIGDSGGPLQASDPNNGRVFLIGIQSKGQSCKDKELAANGKKMELQDLLNKMDKLGRRPEGESAKNFFGARNLAHFYPSSDALEDLVRNIIEHYGLQKLIPVPGEGSYFVHFVEGLDKDNYANTVSEGTPGDASDVLEDLVAKIVGFGCGVHRSQRQIPGPGELSTVAHASHSCTPP
ncbi:trypsin domain-containing protein [Ditylenchus destructor]|uniref:Trypsin domain-containing protein n=1 Tax=Ditylenchus destructor TaxID=166010 RepID=A0AAD4MT64_9BILA|nr:trypsin domain-containing protein [Ditylenchus destructor]